VHRALPAFLVALALAGCGGKSSSPGPSGGASVAPASTALLVRANTAEWDTVAPLLEAAGATLPDPATLKGALGPETDALALTADDLAKKTFLGLTQPPDPAKLDTLLAKHTPPLVSEEVAGWHVIATDRATIDRLKRARNQGSLADSSAYKDASEGLPENALGSVYADGAALSQELGRRLKAELGPIPGVGRVSWAAGAVSSRPGGLDVQLRIKGDEIEAEQFAAQLPAEVPTPVSVFIDAKGLDRTLDELKRMPALMARLGAISQALGSGLLDDLIALFRGEAAVYVRPLPKGPEYTLVIKVPDETAARGVLDRLATLAGALGQSVPKHLDVGGVDVTKITLGKTTLYAAVFAGKAVVTSAPSGIRGLERMGPHLADSPSWKAATAAAALPDQTAGIVYADLQRALPLLESLLGAKSAAPPKQLHTGLFWASVEGSVLTVRGFVSIR
jgi:Protein of unknown function (DUF3352)